MTKPRTGAGKAPAPARGAGNPTEEYFAGRGIGSIKLRLPRLVLERLDELARAQGCSRTAVIERLVVGAR